MQASAELQVPTSEAAAVQIVVQVTDDSKVTVSLGSLSLSSGADTVQLVMGAQQAACLGMDGTCLVTLASSRRNLETGGEGAEAAALVTGARDNSNHWRRMLSASTATLNVRRVYTHSSSPNASVPVSDLINTKLHGLGANVTSMQQTGLTSTISLAVQSSAAASPVDEAFNSRTTFNQQLGIRLPGVPLSVSTPSLIEPPSPPPPPPPRPPPQQPSPLAPPLSNATTIAESESAFSLIVNFSAPGTVETFDAQNFTTSLARILKVAIARISLRIFPGSVIVESTVGYSSRAEANAGAALINNMSPSDLEREFGMPVTTVGLASIVTAAGVDATDGRLETMFGNAAVYGFGIATGLAIVGCFLIGFMAARFRRGRSSHKVMDIPKATKEDDAAEGHRARIGEDEATEAEDATWRVPTPRGERAGAPAPAPAPSPAPATIPSTPSAPPPPPTGLLSDIFGDGDDSSPDMVTSFSRRKLRLAPLEDAPKPISRADEIARQLAVKELAHGVDEEHEAKLETEREALRAELRALRKMEADEAAKQAAPPAPPDRPPPPPPPPDRKPPEAPGKPKTPDRKAPSKPPPPRPSSGSPPTKPNKPPPPPPGVADPASPSLPKRAAPVLRSAIQKTVHVQQLSALTKQVEDVPMPMADAKVPTQEPSMWDRVRSAHASKAFAHSKTMFDDGRFLRSVVLEAKAAGLQPARGRRGAGQDEAPPVLRRMTTRGMAKPPKSSDLMEGSEGGGGVRVFPPNLQETLATYSDSFQPAAMEMMPRTRSMVEDGAAEEASASRKSDQA